MKILIHRKGGMNVKKNRWLDFNVIAFICICMVCSLSGILIPRIHSYFFARSRMAPYQTTYHTTITDKKNFPQYDSIQGLIE